MHFAALVKFNLQFLFCFILQILLHVLILLILNAAYLANSYLILIQGSLIAPVIFDLSYVVSCFRSLSFCILLSSFLTGILQCTQGIIAKTLPQGKAKIQDISFFLELAQGPSTYFKSTLFSRFRKIVFNKKTGYRLSLNQFLLPNFSKQNE
jgi:hypothetical protein